MKRQDSFTALLKANSVPKTVLEPEVAGRGTIAGLTTSGAPLSRVRDRATVRENLPPEAKPETLYEQEVRLFGKYWAEVYRQQREEKIREEREAAEDACVRHRKNPQEHAARIKRSIYEPRSEHHFRERRSVLPERPKL